MAGTLEIPSVGEKNTTADPKLKTGLETFNNLLEASNKIPGTSLATAAAIADTQLASPNNSAYKVLFAAHGFGTNGLAAGTYSLGSSNAGVPIASGANLFQGAVPIALPLFYFIGTDYEVAGKTQKLRLRAQFAANATKPTIKFTFGLYPVTSAGGGLSEIKLTLGTVVTGSTAEINEPAASTITQKENSDFTVPATGSYVLGVVTSGTMTTNAMGIMSAQLLSRNV